MTRPTLRHDWPRREKDGPSWVEVLCVLACVFAAALAMGWGEPYPEPWDEPTEADWDAAAADDWGRYVHDQKGQWRMDMNPFYHADPGTRRYYCCPPEPTGGAFTGQ